MYICDKNEIYAYSYRSCGDDESEINYFPHKPYKKIM